MTNIGSAARVSGSPSITIQGIRKHAESAFSPAQPPDMPAPPLGEVVRHQPSGLTVRVQRLIGTHRNIVQILFADGEVGTAHLREIEMDLTAEEKLRFARDLPIISGEARSRAKDDERGMA